MLIVKGREKIIFLPVTFLVIRVAPARIPHYLESLQAGSWENWQKSKKVRILNKISSRRSLLLVPGQERRLAGKNIGKITSLNWAWCICFWVQFVVDLFSPGDSYCLLICHTLCPEDLTWQPSGGGCKHWLNGKLDCTSLATGILVTATSWYNRKFTIAYLVTFTGNEGVLSVKNSN